MEVSKYPDWCNLVWLNKISTYSAYPKKPQAITLTTLMLFLAMGCQPSSVTTDREIVVLKAGLADTARPGLASKSAEHKKLWVQTQDFYQRNESRPVWIVGGEALDSVKKLTDLLANAENEGLNPQEYGVANILTRVQELENGVEPPVAMALELDLTYVLLRYATHAALGHPIPEKINADWDIELREMDIPGIVLKAVASKELSTLPDTLAPPHPEYLRLKEMLKRYRTFAAEDKLQQVPTNLRIKASETGPGLAALRNNLLILGDLQEKQSNDDNVFKEDLSTADAEFKDRAAVQPEVKPDAVEIAVVNIEDNNLGDAVRRFEARHGLNPDGVPDPAMITAMNVPAMERVRQIELNMERWRWLPADFGSPYILVNIPGYRMQVRDSREEVPLKMRVIVGKTTNRTPVFSDIMTTVVFSPYWNIPQSIEVKEMWPKIQNDSEYLAKKQIEVLRMVDGEAVVVDPGSIDWDDPEDEGHLMLRQKSGAGNALGLVKFIFPNHHNVYLHDTPSDNLFAQLTRDLSHGCVRVEEPAALAAYLLRDQSEWTAESIQTAMHSGEEKQVALKNPIPVHIVYLTARVDEDGVPQFFDDVYGYDQKTGL